MDRYEQIKSEKNKSTVIENIRFSMYIAHNKYFKLRLCGKCNYSEHGNND